MSDFLVTVKLEPSRSFIVENAGSHQAARQRVLQILVTDPGVEVEVIQTPIAANEKVLFPNLGGVR